MESGSDRSGQLQLRFVGGRRSSERLSPPSPEKRWATGPTRRPESGARPNWNAVGRRVSGRLVTATERSGRQLLRVKLLDCPVSGVSRSQTPEATDPEESVVESYPSDVRIVKHAAGDDAVFRFEATHHVDVAFEDVDTALLYADVYFDVNGFREEGTGEHGIPPAVFQGGKDTLAAYLLTRPGVDVNWVASFFGVDRAKAELYVSWVCDRADQIRRQMRERGME